MTIIFRFSQCWNQVSDSGEEGESIDKLIDSVTDMKKSSSNTVFDTVAKLWSANCQIAESIVLQNNCKHDQLQCVQGAGGVARTAWSRCQSGHGGGQAEQGC